MTTPTFEPISTRITNISQANPGVVTTSVANGYQTGFQVRIFLPGDFGMQQLNNNVFTITVINSTNFSINVDTRGYDSFAIGSNLQVPQCDYVGEPSTTLSGAFRNSLTPIGGGI